MEGEVQQDQEVYIYLKISSAALNNGVHNLFYVLSLHTVKSSEKEAGSFGCCSTGE